MKNIRLSYHNTRLPYKKRLMLENFFLFEAAIDRVVAANPDLADGLRQYFSDIKPKYLTWAVKQLKDLQQISGDVPDHSYLLLSNSIKDFDNFSELGFIKNKDINTYKNLKQVQDVIESSKIQKRDNDEKKHAKKQNKKIYEDKQYLIIQPMSMVASCFYGKGTKWCISAEQSNHFESYSERGIKFIFIIDKTNNDKDAIAYHPKVKNKLEIFDAEDNEKNIKYLYDKYSDSLLDHIWNFIGFKVDNFNLEKFINNPIPVMNQHLSDSYVLYEMFHKENPNNDQILKLILNISKDINMLGPSEPPYDEVISRTDMVSLFVRELFELVHDEESKFSLVDLCKVFLAGEHIRKYWRGLDITLHNLFGKIFESFWKELKNGSPEQKTNDNSLTMDWGNSIDFDSEQSMPILRRDIDVSMIVNKIYEMAPYDSNHDRKEAVAKFIINQNGNFDNVESVLGITKKENKEYYIPNLKECFFLTEAAIDRAKKANPELADVLGKYFEDIKPKYLPWVIKTLKKDPDINDPTNFTMIPIEQAAPKIREDIDSFDQFANKNLIQNNDITSYKTWADLIVAINNAKKKYEKSSIIKKEKSKTDKIYEDETYLVISPQSKTASCYYGKGSRWCISATESENYFESYSNNGYKFVFIINKKTNDKDAVAYRPGQSNSVEVFDIHDDQYSTNFLLEKYPQIIIDAIQNYMGFEIEFFDIEKFINNPIPVMNKFIGHIENLVDDFLEKIPSQEQLMKLFINICNNIDEFGKMGEEETPHLYDKLENAIRYFVGNTIINNLLADDSSDNSIRTLATIYFYGSKISKRFHSIYNKLNFIYSSLVQKIIMSNKVMPKTYEVMFNSMPDDYNGEEKKIKIAEYIVSHPEIQFESIRKNRILSLSKMIL